MKAQRTWGGVMRVFVAFGGLLAATGFACAADLPGAPLSAPPPRAPAAFVAPQPYSWTGFYVGANAGGTFVNVNDTATITGTLLGNATATSSGNATGAVAGGQLGFNYQIGPAVFGLEGDFDYSSISKTAIPQGSSQKHPKYSGSPPFVAAEASQLIGSSYTRPGASPLCLHQTSLQQRASAQSTAHHRSTLVGRSAVELKARSWTIGRSARNISTCDLISA